VSTNVPATKQVAAHAPLVQLPDAHAIGVEAAQPPLPSQKRAGCTLLVSAQPAAAHCVPLPGYVQARRLPAPHAPAQAPEPAQAARVPCGAPDVTAVQVPAEPETSQASHWPLQAASQHTPSTQRALWHCELAVQAVPLGRAALQLPLTQ
jgi:hypothetical protein